MKFLFNYETKASDLWQLSMYGIYKSMVGLVNVIFTAAMVLLTAKYWSEVNWYLKGLLILGLSLFTVIQPLLIYRRAK
ncbi:MAG: YcxB family protein, partial [Clostridia bacterium]|nr:YcxB family protein [Clostridia bacterium]